MTDFILAWVLVTIGGHSIVSYSPPMATQEECQQLAAWIQSKSNTSRLCMPMHVLKSYRREQ